MWTASYGASAGNNRSKNLSIDNFGNVYVSGTGIFSDGNTYLILLKYDINGQRLFATHNSQKVYDFYDVNYYLGTDNSGNIYTICPISASNYYNNILITKFNSIGQELWYRIYNSQYNWADVPVGSSVTSNGDVIVAGNIQTDSVNHNKIAILKYDSSGQLNWERNIGNQNGNYYVGAYTSDVTGNAYLEYRNYIDNKLSATTVKYDTAGNVKWSIDYIGAQYNTIAKDIKTDLYGNIYLGGYESFGTNTYFLTIRYIQSWSLPSSITGCVKFQNNNLNVSSGIVKALKIDRTSGNLICIDSATILANGNYILNNITQDTIYIVAFPSSAVNDFVPAFYPSGIYWQAAQKIYTSTNLSNINIIVPPLINAAGNSSVSGKVMVAGDVNSINIKDAILYAKSGNNFIKFDASDYLGIYHLNSIANGSVKIIVNRIGYSGDSLIINIPQNGNLDSVNFYLNRVYVKINKISSEIPDKYSLYQNYPNPFNPSTIIRYSINKNTNVKLIIYDILGKEITTLVDEKQNIGTYEIKFNMKNLSSGIYFYRLVTNDFEQTKRMMLLK